jgi:HK97 family phage portal protein
MSISSRIASLFSFGETRSNPMENPSMSLSAGLLSLGLGNYTDSNENVTEQTSLEVPTVLACVRILSEGVGSIPFRVYEELGRGRKPAKDHHLFYLLTQEPNPEMPAVTFISTMMTHAALWQNAYAEIERDNSGRAAAFWPRMPWRTKPARVNGRLVFKTTDTPNGVERVIDAANMLHIVGFSLDGLTGSSLIANARQTIGLAMVAARFGARFYANGARPGFFLQPDAPLSPEDMTLLRQDVEMLSSGANVHRIAALPIGIKVVPAIKDPSAMQEYINTRKYERDEIAAFMRVPGYMIGSTEKVMKSTIEAQNQEFLTYSLRPWLERFEQEFQRKLLPPVGRASGKYTLHFYVDALLAVDTALATAKYTAGRNGGWYSANDIREMQGMECIPVGGDDYLIPLNTVNAASAAEAIETDEEPSSDETGPDEPVKASRAKELYGPIFTDAFTRLQHRSKKDLESITRALTPAITSLGAYFRTSTTVGTAETQAVEKYLKGLEGRAANLTGDVAVSELDRVVKSIVFAVSTDAAEAQARKVINE